MRLRRNSIANVLGTGVRSLFAFMTQLVLIRVLGLERYGVWIVLLSAVGLSSLAELGLSSALTIFLAEAYSRQDEDSISSTLGMTLSGITIIGLVTSCLWLFGANWLQGVLFPARADDREILVTLQILGLGLLPRLWQQWIIGWEAGLSRYDLQAKGESISLVILNIGLMVLALLHRDFVVLSWWYVVVSSITVLYHWYLVKQIGVCKLRWHGGRQRILELLRFSWIHWVTNICGILFGKVDRLVVNAVLGLDAVGLYAAATSIVVKINELSALPVQPITPEVSAAYARRDLSRLRTLFEHAVTVNALIVYAMVTTVLWGASYISAVIAPNQASELSMLLQTLGLAYALYSLMAVAYYTLMGLKEPQVTASATLIGAVITLLAIWLLAPTYGLRGVAWANASYSIIWVMNVHAARRVGISLRHLIKMYGPFFVSLLGCFVLRQGVAQLDSPRPLLVLGWCLSILLCFWIDKRDIVAAWDIMWSQARASFRKMIQLTTPPPF